MDKKCGWDLKGGRVTGKPDIKSEYLIMTYEGPGTMHVDIMGGNQVRLLISPPPAQDVEEAEEPAGEDSE